MEIGGAMKNVLTCIASDYLWLFEKYGFRIIDSFWDPSFGGQGMVALSNGSIQIRFNSDRDQVIIEFFPQESGWPTDEFITVDLLYTRITGGFLDAAVVSENTTSFLYSRFDEILALFSGVDSEALISEFRKLKKERSKRLFG